MADPADPAHPTYPVVLRRPPRLGTLVRRPRLHAPSPVVVLTGPAGLGKTTAALDLATGLAAGPRLVWCRLADGYGTPRDLVGIAHLSLGRDPPAALARGADPLEVLFELVEEAPTAVVVDDYDRGSPDALDPFLAEAISYAPESTSFFVTSERRPAGLLGRTAPGLVAVRGPDDLAFTTDEAVELFASYDRGPGLAAAWCELAGGRADVLSWAAATGIAPRTGIDELVARVVERLDDRARDVVVALSLVPYLTEEVARAASLGDGAALADAAGRVPFVRAGDGVWQLDGRALDAVRHLAGASDLDDRRRRLAAAFRPVDPAVSVDLLLDAGADAAAAELLAEAAGELPLDRGFEWAYRLPADLRRVLPPVLTAARATVDVDLAVAAAERRVAAATDDDVLGDALFALGSAQLSAGELSGAAAALERATRLGRDSVRAGRAWTWLAVARWWLGDLDGAEGALAQAPDDTWTAWAAGFVAVARGDLVLALAHADDAIERARASGATEALGRSCRAVVTMLGGEADPSSTSAMGEASAADRAGATAGGLDLLWGGFVHAVALARAERFEDALAVCGRLAKVVGQEAHGRLLDAQVRRYVAARVGDADERNRHDRRLAELRGRGFSPLARLGDALLPDIGRRGLAVRLLGRLQVTVDDVDVAGRWRSNKGLEVLLALALAARRGLSREEVIEMVWPGRDPVKGRTLLRTALAEIRRVLEPTRPAGEASRFLLADGERLVVPASVDVVDAEACLQGGRTTEAFRLVQPGLAPLDVAEEWAEELARRVARLRIDAADRVAWGRGGDQVVAEDDRAEALLVLVDHEPWRREPYDALAAIHRARGDEAAARAIERRWFDDES